MPLAEAFRGPIPDVLPPGKHAYDDIVSDCRQGSYGFAMARARSGRLNFLLGLTREHLRHLEDLAWQFDVGLVLLGSRISGPRSRQRGLHPVLKNTLDLQSSRRAATAAYPGAEGIVIDKTAIKEFGPGSPHASDLSIILIDRAQRSNRALDTIAGDLELMLMGLGRPFPVRVFSQLNGRHFRCERDFESDLIARLRGRLPEGHRFTERDILDASRELFLTINLPAGPFTLRDVGNGLAAAALLSASFWLGLGWHPVVAATGFAFGLCGRYLSRLRAAIAFTWGDTMLSNAAALAADAAIGVLAMAAVINPVAGFGLSLQLIAAASLSHGMAKGSIRLFLDKLYSGRREGEQAAGVLVAGLVNFLQGVITNFVYAGSPWAIALQSATAGIGLALVFGRPILRLWKGTGPHPAT